MTLPPHHDPPSDDEDLNPAEAAVHAVLDDEADAEQRRRVARDPLLTARLSELRAVADQVATPPAAPPAATFDRLRALALEHLAAETASSAAALPPSGGAAPTGASGAGGAPSPPPGGVVTLPPPADGTGPTDRVASDGGLAPVRPLAPRRARRATARRLPPLPAVAAIVIVLMAIGVSLLVGGRDQDEDLTAARGSTATEGGGLAQQGDVVEEESLDREADSDLSAEDSGSAATGGDPRPADEEVDGAAPQTTVGSSAPAFADEAALRDALARADPASLVLEGSEGGSRRAGEVAPDPAAAARALSAGPEAQRCSAVLQASDPAIGPTTAAATVSVDGEELLVLTNEVMATAEEPSATQLTVFDPVGCVPRLAVRR